MPTDTPIAHRIAQIEAMCDTAPLTAARERELVLQMQAGDTAARDELVQRNIRFIAQQALRYTNAYVEFEDVFSEACDGFLAGLERFEPDRGFKLISYAVWWIRQRCIYYLRSHAGTVRRPFPVVTHRHAARAAAERLGHRHGRAPSLEAVAAETGLRPDQVLDGLRAGQDLRLDTPPPGAPDDGLTLADTLVGAVADPEVDARRAVLRERLLAAIDRLPARKRRIVLAYYGFTDEGHTLDELGAKLGITRERVRQLRNMALGELREHLAGAVDASAIALAEEAA